MERRKTAAADRTDKIEVKKERNFSRYVLIFRQILFFSVNETNVRDKRRILSIDRLTAQTNIADSTTKADADNDDNKQKDKSPKADVSPHTDHSPVTPSGQPAYVPYALYSKLLERVSIKMIHYTSYFVNFYLSMVEILRSVDARNAIV